MKRFLVVAGIASAVACTGPRGYPGPQGPPGMTGAQGPTGLTGSQGQPGMTESYTQPDPVAGWVSLRDIVFEIDKAEIRPTEMGKISDIASYVGQNSSVHLAIAGATDLSRSGNQHSVALRQRRVANVRDALTRAGVSTDRIDAGSFTTDRARCNDSTGSCSERIEVLAR